jgi:Protein of unknown function (DUF4127)
MMNRHQFLRRFSWGLVVIPSFLNTLRSSKSNSATTTSPVNSTSFVNAALAKIQTLNTEFPLIGVYHRPNDQDRKSAGSGMGIYPCNGSTVCTEADRRSELIYPPFVMATRRQTDGLVRQAYALLPKRIRQTTAFVIVDRLVQSPEAYLPYLRRKSQVVLIGSFSGIGNVQNEADYQKTDDGTGAKTFHRLQLRQLEYAIALIQSLNKPCVDIIYGMGDSINDYALTIRNQLQDRSQNILQQAGLKPNLFTLDWGADELVFKAFARRLPPLIFKVTMANPAAKHHYDGNHTTAEIVRRAIRSLKLTEAKDQNFDAQVFVFDRHPQASANFNQYFPPDDPQQAKFDRQFHQQMMAFTSKAEAKTVIIDGRNPNGALNIASLPSSDKFLAFGSWGTFANVCGQTLAIAKILAHAKNRPAQRQLLLEAIAHDVFCIGYASAQDASSPLRQALQEKQLPYIHKDPPEYSLSQMQQVFLILNSFVNRQMKKYMPSALNTEFVVIPQLWRIFESQVLLKDGPLSIAGVFRHDLPPKTFNPFILIPKIKASQNLEDI